MLFASANQEGWAVFLKYILGWGGGGEPVLWTVGPQSKIKIKEKWKSFDCLFSIYFQAWQADLKLDQESKFQFELKKKVQKKKVIMANLQLPLNQDHEGKYFPKRPVVPHDCSRDRSIVQMFHLIIDQFISR